MLVHLHLIVLPLCLDLFVGGSFAVGVGSSVLGRDVGLVAGVLGVVPDGGFFAVLVCFVRSSFIAW